MQRKKYKPGRIRGGGDALIELLSMNIFINGKTEIIF